jgi:methionyl-tRNA formyltransferase
MKKSDLRIVFMGTPEFAVPSLRQILAAGYNVVGVITAPDKPSGRGKRVKVSAVKQFAIEKKLRLLQPENLKDEGFIEELRELKANLQVVVAFRMLPEQVWAMPPLGTFNLHASLLPQYRGAAPINHAIINGEKYTGLTPFFLDALIDTGKIIKQQKIQIGEDENAGSLHDRMMLAGAGLVEETIALIQNNQITAIDQSKLIPSGDKLRLAPKIFKADCEIDWGQPLERIHNFVRGLSPYPAAFTHFVSPLGKELLVKVYVTTKEINSHHSESGKLITDGKNELKVQVSGGYIHILELQLSSKKRMKTVDFLRGMPLTGEWKVC